MLKKKFKTLNVLTRKSLVIDFFFDFVLIKGFALRPTGVSLSLSNYKQAKNA